MSQHRREAGEQALPRKLEKEAAQLERAQARQESQVRPDLRPWGGNGDVQDLLSKCPGTGQSR